MSEAQIILVRDSNLFTNKSTGGELFINHERFCATLEDTCRAGEDRILQAEEKIKAMTAIPEGIYQLDFQISPKFGYCPFVLNVPLFDAIRIHWGNKPEDTEGCILVGQRIANMPDFIGASKATYINLMDTLIPMKLKETLYLEVSGGLKLDQLTSRMRAA